MQSESVKNLVVQLCLILSDLMDCSPPGSSVHGILQARILEWLPFPSPGDLPNPGIKPRSPALQADSLPFESPGKPWIHLVKFWAGWNPSWNQDWQGKYNNVRYADDTTLMVEREEELKSLLMMMKEESEKAGLKLNNQKTTIIASGSITSWQIDGNTNGNSERLYFFWLQNHCRWWLQPWNYKTLAPWKRSYDKPRQHIRKQSHHFADKDLYSQSYGFFSSHV